MIYELGAILLYINFLICQKWVTILKIWPEWSIVMMAMLLLALLLNLLYSIKIINGIESWSYIINIIDYLKLYIIKSWYNGSKVDHQL